MKKENLSPVLLSKENPAEAVVIKSNNGLIYLKKALPSTIRLKRNSKIQFQKIKDRWYIVAANRFGKGCKISKVDGQLRLIGQYVKELSVRMIGDPINPYNMIVSPIPLKNRDGRNYYPVQIVR